jgi:Tfp pilus assembly protein PilV
VLETLFAFFIISLVLLALFNLFPTSLLSIRQANDRVQAANLAQDLLNWARIQPFPPALPTPSPVTVDGILYTPRVDVSPVRGHDPKRLLNVRVTVTWEMQGRHQELVQELRTCVISRR